MRQKGLQGMHIGNYGKSLLVIKFLTFLNLLFDIIFYYYDKNAASLCAVNSIYQRGNIEKELDVCYISYRVDFISVFNCLFCSFPQESDISNYASFPFPSIFPNLRNAFRNLQFDQGKIVVEK